MKEFKAGDGFVCSPYSKICFLEITKIGEWDDVKKKKQIEYKRYTYDNNSMTYNENEYETGIAYIMLDEEKHKEYVQIDHWLTHKYCIRHVVYCE